MRERGPRPDIPALPPRSIEVPQHVTPINWWRLDDAERAEVFGVLRGFVTEFVRRYALPASVVPPCWYRHEAIVQELLAFYQYRDQLQLAEGPAASHAGAPLEVHVQLHMLRGRLREIVQCNEAEHFDDAIPAWAVPETAVGALWSEDFDEFVKVEEGQSDDW